MSYVTVPRGGVGFLPVVASILSVGAQAYQAKTQADAAKDAAKSAASGGPSQLDVRLRRLMAKEQLKTTDQADRRQLYGKIAIGVAVVAVGGLVAWTIARRRR